MLYKHEKEIIQHHIEGEKKILKALEREYEVALKQINARIRLLQSDVLTQSKIYRIQYQEALKAQIEAILEKLHADEYSTIQQYLSDSYTDGFVGTIYSMHKQGVPLVLPIDKNAAAKAVVTDSKIKGSLYEALGIDVDAMKKSITQELTRGISSGLSFDDIARNIKNKVKAPLANIKRIVRTEGHRIQETSTDDARREAKKKGANVVKQWDAILDGVTRPTHQQLDGQIRETDDYFEVAGKRAKYPGAFGDPAEDCNCRCVALTRARKALDEDELEELKERAKYFGLDKNDSFEDFKGKYLKAAEEVAKRPDVPLPRTLSNYDDTVYWAEEERISNFEMYRGLPEEYHKPFDTFEEETPKYEKQLSTAFEKFDFSSNTDSNAIEQILKDGRLKGTVETHTSNGELDVDLRKRATSELFGLWDDVDSMEDKEFEKYGYLGTADRAKMYGDCRIVFKKDNLWDRTTFTVGDSLEAHVNGGYKTPSKVSDPKIISFSKDPFTPDQPDINEIAIRNIKKAFDSIEEHGYFKGVINNEDYVELQFHGTVLLDDISYIEVPQSSANLADILAIAEEKGVKIKVKK